MDVEKDKGSEHASDGPMTRARSRMRANSVGSIPKVMASPARLLASPAGSIRRSLGGDADGSVHGSDRVEIEDIGSDYSFDMNYPPFNWNDPRNEVIVNANEPVLNAAGPVAAPVVIPPAAAPVPVAPVVVPVIEQDAPREEVQHNGQVVPQNPPAIDEMQVRSQKLMKEARRLIQDCQEFVDINEPVTMNPVTLKFVDKEAKRLVSDINRMCDKFDDIPDTGGADRELIRWKTILLKFVAMAMNKVSVSPPPPVVVQPPPPAAQPVQQ